MELPTISHDPAVQARYEQMRADGQSHNLAEMFALQAPPMSDSDREFWLGHHNGAQFQDDPRSGDHHLAIAKRAGVNPKGKVYISGLADYPGDPRAWVSGRDEVKSICEKNGWGCRGAVNVKMRSRDKPHKKVDVADDLVNEHVKNRVAADPGLAEKPVEELKEQSKATLKGSRK